MITRTVLLTLALLCFGAPTATAQIDAPAPTAQEAYVDSGSARSKSDEWMIPPGNTGTVGLEFAFLTADRNPLRRTVPADQEGLGGLGALTEGSIDLTDIVLLRLQGRYSIAGAAELIVDTSLLPKQPSYTDEAIVQHAGLGFRIGLTRWLAAVLRADGGPTFEQAGLWGNSAVGLQGRFPIDDYVQFDLSVFGAGTALFIDDEAPRFFEVGTGGQVVFFWPGICAGWLGTDFHFPVASEGTESYPIDPRVRVGINVGAVLSTIDKWDLYLKYSISDRGDSLSPNTQLPILEGGFDQQILTAGIVRRFGDEPNRNY